MINSRWRLKNNCIAKLKSVNLNPIVTRAWQIGSCAEARTTAHDIYANSIPDVQIQRLQLLSTPADGLTQVTNNING